MTNLLLEQYLPKWSRMVVVGDSITEDQAGEILVRTSDFNFSSNDTNWRAKLYQVLEIPYDKSKGYFGTDYDKVKEVEKSLKVLPLNYLRNNQIISCYIGGPHGWCNWYGSIGCDGYNIGKWPNVKSVFEEWNLIAKTWPFLNLRCQLWNTEYDDEDSDCSPVIEFVVANGSVSVINPIKVLYHTKTTGYAFNSLMLKGERGCTLDQFRKAIDAIKNKQAVADRE